MNEASDLRLQDIHVGDRAALERTISVSDIDTFAQVSGDHGPLHVDEEYARTTPFGKRVAHGMFLGALVSQLVGMQLPGKRALLLKESLEFKKPVFIGDTVHIEGVVTGVSAGAGIVALDIKIMVVDTIVAAGSLQAQVRE